MAKILVGNIKGAKGNDGVSPTVDAVKVDGVTTVTTTDAKGVEQVEIHDGEKGVGVLGVEVMQDADTQARISIALTDGTFEEFPIYLPSGKNGVGVYKVEQTTTSTADGGNNVITVTLTDGEEYTFTIKNGRKGSTGAAGKDGTSVTVKSVSESTADGGSNVVTFSDGNTLTVKNGGTGRTGEAGKDGQDGADGVGISSMEVMQITDAEVVVDILLTDNTNKQFSLRAPQGKTGETGPAGADGATTAEVIAALTKETWVFTLADGTTVEKVVPLI